MTDYRAGEIYFLSYLAQVRVVRMQQHRFDTQICPWCVSPATLVVGVLSLGDCNSCSPTCFYLIQLQYEFPKKQPGFTITSSLLQRLSSFLRDVAGTMWLPLTRSCNLRNWLFLMVEVIWLLAIGANCGWGS